LRPSLLEDILGAAPEQAKNHVRDLMQAGAYSGYNNFYARCRKPGEIIEAACWAHGRRKFFELAELQKGAGCDRKR
jgi:transposase